MGGIFDLANRRTALEVLERKAGDPSLWDDQEKAQKILQERASLEAFLGRVDRILANIEDAEALLELFEAEEEDGDSEMLSEVEQQLAETEELIDAIEFERMLGGKMDKNNAIVSINSGAGGTESCDWAAMLERMLVAYCHRKGWKTTVTDYQAGDEAGIKSVTFRVEGEYAYGYLKAEAGVHRLVRISPFDASARRHTSFASVFVYPELDDDIEVELDENDIRVDTYRASGAGGQHVNKTDSAVRMTHIPTGIVVQCQNERSQHKNRAYALKMLKARLYDLELKKKQSEMDAVNAQKKDIAWGSQIRSYVLHPYRLVKDLRTGLEVGDVDSVLNGRLDRFIEAYLIKFGTSNSLHPAEESEA